MGRPWLLTMRQEWIEAVLLEVWRENEIQRLYFFGRGRSFLSSELVRGDKDSGVLGFRIRRNEGL
jgi:hypothetical protein